jgi:hypothetical protein
MTADEMASEAQRQPGLDSADSTLEINVSTVATCLCLVAVVPLVILGWARAAPLPLQLAVVLYVSSRFGWRDLLARAWHYNDGGVPGATFLTHVYVVLCCAALILLLLQIPVWIWPLAPSY